MYTSEHRCITVAPRISGEQIWWLLEGGAWEISGWKCTAAGTAGTEEYRAAPNTLRVRQPQIPTWRII